MAKLNLIDITHPKHSERLAEILLNGGVVGAIWGHHLYFLACNACDSRAVARMNSIKGRPKGQVFASPGAVEEAEEFSDFKKNQALLWASKQMKMTPRGYLTYLYRKFPLAVELYANNKAPSAVTFATDSGKTIWIAGHMGDRVYSKFLEVVRSLRKSGHRVVFAGTSLNLPGENTLTVKQLDQVIANFEDKIDAISVHPNADKLKKLRYATSCSAVSFIGSKPRLLRVGCTSLSTLKKYIPGLIIPEEIRSTRR